MVEIGRTYTKTKIDTELAARDASLTNHLNDTVDAHDASAISFVPTTYVTATNVQQAIGELGAETSSFKLYNVADYGALGIGWDSRDADQTAHAAAFSAANAATWGGVIYTPPGEFYLTGNFTLGKRSFWAGAGNGRTIVSHYDTATKLITSLADGNSGGEFPQRGVKGLRIYGNTGASALAIHMGNCSFPALEDMTISGYTAGACIRLDNTLSFTENVRLTGVQTFDSLVGLDIVGYASPRHSFGGLQLNNCLFNAGIDNAVGMRVGANAYIYGAFISSRFVGERTSAVGLDVNGSATLTGSLYQINSEGLPDAGQANGGTGLKLRTGATMTGSGIVSLQGNISNDIQSGTTYTIT